MTDFETTCAGVVDYAISRYYSNDLSTFDDWFSQLTYQIKSLVVIGEMSEEMSQAALSACCDLLELDIPHEGHIKSVIWIRLVLEPEVSIEDHDDWPFDVTDYLGDDEI